jgi:hypothetical protein
MAIIDLGSGEVDRTDERKPVGRVIDLDTGEFVEPATPSLLHRLKLYSYNQNHKSQHSH